MDEAHNSTDRQLKALEKRLHEIYQQSAEEVSDKWQEYIKYMDKRLKSEYNALQAAVKSGDVGEIQKAKEKYQHSLKINTLYSERYQALTEQMAENISHVNETATAIINGELPETYSVNYNYFADSLNSLSGDYQNISFTLVDENTVKLLSESDVNLLPYKTVDSVKDVRWNVKKINAEVLQGILQGESVYKIANRFQNVLAMDEVSAIRNARTTLTSAENKGRMDMMARAQEAGIKCRKIWMSASDIRTRPWHRELDGKIVDKDKPFENSIGKIMYPGDPTADGANVYNCRCSLGYKLDGFDKSKKRENNSNNLLTNNPKASIIKEASKSSAKNMLSHYSPQSKLGKELKSNADISYNRVEYYDSQPSEKEIIKLIGGKDSTDGSCSSLALAYLASKNGMNVSDYRGGKSQKCFSDRDTIKELLNVAAINGKQVRSTNDFKAAEELLSSVSENKEYYLGVGLHAAVVRKNSKTGKLQYLELQEKGRKNKFKKLNKYKLKSRFKCEENLPERRNSFLIEGSSLKGDEIRYILGYINTNKE